MYWEWVGPWGVQEVSLGLLYLPKDMFQTILQCFKHLFVVLQCALYSFCLMYLVLLVLKLFFTLLCEFAVVFAVCSFHSFQIVRFTASEEQTYFVFNCTWDEWSQVVVWKFLREVECEPLNRLTKLFTYSVYLCCISGIRFAGFDVRWYLQDSHQRPFTRVQGTHDLPSRWLVRWA